MLHSKIGLFCVLVLLVTSCSAQCPDETLSYMSNWETSPISSVEDSAASGSTSREVRTLLGLLRKPVDFDQIVEGNICGDTWRGTVYVTCNISIPAWETNPFFLEECPVSIESGSVVYVEAHRDKAYYEGCSCHE